MKQRAERCRWRMLLLHHICLQVFCMEQRLLDGGGAKTGMFRTVSTGTISRSDELEETTINASPNGKTAPCAPPICATEAEIPPAMDSLPANEPLSILIVEDDSFMR